MAQPARVKVTPLFGPVSEEYWNAAAHFEGQQSIAHWPVICEELLADGTTAEAVTLCTPQRALVAPIETEETLATCFSAYRYSGEIAQYARVYAKAVHLQKAEAVAEMDRSLLGLDAVRRQSFDAAVAVYHRRGDYETVLKPKVYHSGQAILLPKKQ